MPDDVKLKVYGYFKQASEGDCPHQTSGLRQWLDRKEAKRYAWAKLAGTSKAEAQTKYIELLKTIGVQWPPAQEDQSLEPLAKRPRR